jgi:CHAT domain-containing protein/tetratricopeptide (TPR) repeat protein
VAGTLHRMMQLSIQAEEFPAAIEYGQRTLKLLGALLGETHWRTTNYKLDLADVELKAKLSKQQRAEWESAHQLMWEGRQLYQRSEYAKAERLYQEGLRIYKQLVGEKHPDYARGINALAALYDSQGLYAKAEPLYKQALKIRKEVLGERHPDYATTLNNLAFLYDAQGLLAKAEPLFKQALEIHTQVLGKYDLATATSLNNLAVLYKSQGLYTKAEPLYREALKIRLGRLTEKSTEVAASLNNLANLYLAQGLFAKAEDYYRYSLGITKSISGPKDREYAVGLNNLAFLYQTQRLYAKAEPLYIEALEIRKDTLGRKHPEYATSLNNLADLYQLQNQSEKAEPLYREALQIRKDTLGEKHPDYAMTLNNLGYLFRARGAFAKATPLYKEAVQIMEEHLEQTAAVQSEAGQLTYTARARLHLDNLLDLPQTDDSEVYSIAFRWRGVVTARQTFARAARSSDPAVRQIVDHLRIVSQKLSNLVNNPPLSRPGVDVPKMLRDLAAEREGLEKQLAEQSKNFASYRANRSLQATDIQKLLPPDAVLVDFLAYGNNITAFIVSPKSITRVNLKNSASNIAELVNDFRSLSSLKRTRPVQGAEDHGLLREAVWEPLVPHLKGVNTVLICPDGPLCQLPFAALRGSDPKKYLIEEVAIAVIPVPRLLPDLLATRPAGSPSLLLVGDVDFSSNPSGAKPLTDPARTGALLAWKPLAATAGEIQKIEELFRKNVAGSIVRSLTKGDATEAAIGSTAGKCRYLHFATHGFFDDPKPSVSAPNDRTRGANPGLLCGLVCAGANRPTPDDDGILTALEIADLDLEGVELAVLSACETGLGQVAGGDGVLGLQRAFQLAGAKTTVTSLWQVPDEATGSLMTRFYENRLKQGMPALKALREAQLWVLNDGVEAGVLKEAPRSGRRTPPLFWAAFVLAGDWR